MWFYVKLIIYEFVLIIIRICYFMNKLNKLKVVIILYYEIILLDEKIRYI